MKIKKSDFISDIFEHIKYAVAKYMNEHGNFRNFIVFKSFVLNEIISLVNKNDMLPIRDEIVFVNNKKEHIDLVIYKNEIAFVSIEICWSFIRKSIVKLLANDSEYYILISIHPDKSLPNNFLKRFDSKSKIQLLHLPKIKFKKQKSSENESYNSLQTVHYSVVDSPLERRLEKRLKEENLNFTSQYAVYEKSDTGRMNAYPKYIVDFVVKGEYCKIAIECDGLYYHLKDSSRVYDTKRDLWLLKSGFDNVLRFNGDEIREDLDGCIQKIKTEVDGWDKFYKKKKNKSLIQTSKINKTPCKEDVQLIVNDIAKPIASTINNIKKKEIKNNPKIIIKQIKTLISKSGYSNEIPLLYYSFPELSKYVNQIQGLYIGYNIPFVICILKSELKATIPSYFKKEKRILKIFIKFDSLGKETVGVEQYVMIDGWTGKVIDSDILKGNLLEERYKENENVAKQKFYVVWSGKQTGIFNTWEECKKQVNGVKGAKYKAFLTEQEAKEAFEKGLNHFTKLKSDENVEQLSLLDDENFIEESISVDASCIGNPGEMEYRGVYTKNGREIFRFGPIPNGTNNIGEFLAIVHALALMKQKNSTLPVYSDSLTAINWVRQKKANTNLPKDHTTERIWNIIERAEKWLQNNTYSNEIIKWETEKWGENKADFGRK